MLKGCLDLLEVFFRKKSYMMAPAQLFLFKLYVKVSSEFILANLWQDQIQFENKEQQENQETDRTTLQSDTISPYDTWDMNI